MKVRKKNIVKMLSICLAFVLAAGSILMVSAGAEKEQEEKAGGRVLYLDTENGDDSDDGLTEETAFKTLKAVWKYFEKLETAEEKTDADRAEDTEEEKTKTVVLCGKTVLSDVQEKYLKDNRVTVLTEKEYEACLKETEESSVPSPVPTPEGEKDETVTPAPTPEGEKDETVTPAPTPEGEKDETVTPAPTPEGEKDETVTPAPTPESEKENGEASASVPEADKNNITSSTPVQEEKDENSVMPAPASDDETEGESQLQGSKEEENSGPANGDPRDAENDVRLMPAVLSLKDGDHRTEDTGKTADGKDGGEDLQTADGSVGNSLLTMAENSRTAYETEDKSARKLPGNDLVGGGTSFADPSESGNNSGDSPEGNNSSGNSSSAEEGNGSENGSPDSAQTDISSGNTHTGTGQSLTPEAPVKTGDLTQMYPFVISLCISCFLLLVLCRTMLEKKRNLSRAEYREELEKFRRDCRIE